MVSESDGVKVKSENSSFSSPEGINNQTIAQPRQKRSSLACIRCRTRHIRCPGGNPCKKCQLAKAKCEYVEAEKKIVVSMKYISKLHEDIARLKKDNATLRNDLKEHERKARESACGPNNTKNVPFSGRPNYGGLPLYGSDVVGGAGVSQSTLMNHHYNETQSQRFSTTFGINQNAVPTATHNLKFPEVIHPTLDKHGRLIQSRTGEKLYVGSSSMTLFGLEIQNMVPSFTSSGLLTSNLSSPSESGTPNSTGGSNLNPNNTPPSNNSFRMKRETEILEKEGNAYKITLAKTNTRPGISISFTLPSYSYAMLLVDTFVNYNDGCFYFFNEGLVKKFLMNLYTGNMEENKKILKRNIEKDSSAPEEAENPIKKDTDDETILETIWFCKILLIFATGEMYLGTESDTHIKQRKSVEKATYESRKRSNANKKTTTGNTLPGAGFFYQASELFTGLFASGAIDNTVKDGGIEVMLLYAFYLQVADCTIASYFYFGLALRSTLILGWHVDAEKDTLNRFELEHRRRIWWTVYMYERMLSSKAGLPLSFTDDSVSTEFPVDLSMDVSDFPKNESDVRGFYVFPPAEYINNCVIITQINAMILSQLYTKQPTHNILPVVSDLVQKLLNWKNALPEFLRIDFTHDEIKVSRLVVNLMTEYFQGMNLAVRPLLFHFSSAKLRELQAYPQQSNKYIDLTKYSKNVLTLLNASFQASINSIKCIWALVPENMVALFGWMDREYLFTSASTLILFNASFGVHDATKEHIDHALTIFTKMKRLGNYPAALRRSQLLKLISVLDFNGVMKDILSKHDDEGLYYKKDTSTDSSLNEEKPLDEETEILNFMSSETSHNSSNKNTGSDNSVVNQSSTQSHHNESHLPNINPGISNFQFHSDFQDQFHIDAEMGDVYTNNDLAGIEGLTYLDAEQKLWSDITSEAGWLNMSNTNQGVNETAYASALFQQTNSANQKPYVDDTGYGEIINQEFQPDYSPM